MKYVITWQTNGTLTEEGAARSLQVFGQWTPSEGVTFREFLSRVDGQGGFAVVETDDPSLILKDAATFSAWFTFSVHPVMEIADAAAIQAEALGFVSSVS